jgi:hypothetical protein
MQDPVVESVGSMSDEHLYYLHYLDALYNPMEIIEDYWVSYMPYDRQWAKHQGPFTDSEEGRKSDFCQTCQQLIWYDDCKANHEQH